MDKEVIMILERRIVEFMVMVAPKIYRQHICVNRKNNKVLYANLNKSLYRCLKSALLFYKNLFSYMRNKGFSIKPYDPCVANKVVNGTHLTVKWHVDDLNISCVESR